MRKNTHTNTFWSIAGSDNSGGAGIQADLKTAQALGTGCATVITALTAQNANRVQHVEPVSPAMTLHQMTSLPQTPRAVKTGMLCNAATVQTVSRHLSSLDSFIICDPVSRSSSGTPLLDDDGISAMKKRLFPLCHLITPNIPETEQLTGHSIREIDDIPAAAAKLLATGARAVLIKGGHSSDQICRDYYCTPNTSCWINSFRHPGPTVHGTGCTLSAAIAAGITLDYLPLDAIVLARAYIHHAIRTAIPCGNSAEIQHHGWPESPEDLPWLAQDPSTIRAATPFPGCGPNPIGLYPLVNTIEEVKKLTALQIPTLQLRIKETDATTIEKCVQQAINITRNSQTHLFINDYWQLAVKYNAYGVHLGQEDLITADLNAIKQAGLRLGTSTHGFAELARINTWRPSYAAMGTVFPSPSKPGLTRHLGTHTLARMVRLAEMPAVAIGGILLHNAPQVAATGVNGIAVISAIKNAENLPGQIDSWQKIFQKQ